MQLMEANPAKAVLIEKVKDTEFSVLANAYSNQGMFAWAMGCDKTRTGLEMVARSKGRNYRLKVKAMTYRKGGIFQHCTIGGLHPWYTDHMLQLPAIEADLFNGLKQGGIDVREVRCPLGGLSNIAYAKINPLGAAIPSRRWASC